MNAAPRLNDEVCKRSDVGPRNSWAAGKVRLLLPVVVVCLATFLATMRMFGGAVEQAARDDNRGNSSVAPVITAKPDHVIVAGGRGSTEIQWNTGNGSMGFVFVTTKDRKPVLFATGAKGKRVVPWIRAGKYVFELYSDDQRRALLATVTVSGTTESKGSPRPVLLQERARWLLVVALIAIVYIAVYLSSKGTLRTTFPTEPTTSPRPLHVGRNLLLGVAAFVCLDGVIFHTGLYVSILAPDSYAGRLAVITFQQWSGRFKAVTACILRGSAYQSDVADFLEHPIARIENVQRESAMVHARSVYKGRDYDMVGTSYDATTGQMTFPPRLTEAQREAIRKSLLQPSQSEMQYSLRLQRDWIPRILNRYSKSATAIVLTPVPRGPFAELPAFSVGQRAPFPEVTRQRTVFSLPEQTFDFLEKPDYYFDAFHLNAKGRQRFTERLVNDLVARLAAAESHASYP